MIKRIIKSISTSFQKKAIGCFLTESKITLRPERERLTEELFTFFFENESNGRCTAIYSYPYIYIYDGTVEKEKLAAHSGDQEIAVYYSKTKMTHINKEEYVSKGNVVQIGAKSSSDGGGGSGNNNNNNNNNNNG